MQVGDLVRFENNMGGEVGIILSIGLSVAKVFFPDGQVATAALKNLEVL
tara:strand:+ start:1092 stop:1238 length:147 start_codon:yes stop_codon:yes gene_type:complete